MSPELFTYGGQVISNPGVYDIGDTRLTVILKPQSPKPAQPPKPPKMSCYGGEANSQATGAIVGSGVAGVIEAPELGGAAYSLYKGARFGAVLSELAGPEAVPIGLIAGSLVGVGVYLYDKNTNGSVSDPINSLTGQCP